MNAYPLALKDMAEAALDMSSVTVAIAATDSIFDPTDQHLDDVNALGAGANLGGVAVNESGTGVLFATTTTTEGAAAALPGVGTDSPVAYVAYVNTGTPSTSRLLYYYDLRAGGSPVAFTNDGGTVRVWFPGGFFMGLGG